MYQIRYFNNLFLQVSTTQAQHSTVNSVRIRGEDTISTLFFCWQWRWCHPWSRKYSALAILQLCRVFQWCYRWWSLCRKVAHWGAGSAFRTTSVDQPEHLGTTVSPSGTQLSPSSQPRSVLGTRIYQSPLLSHARSVIAGLHAKNHSFQSKRYLRAPGERNKN